MNTHVVVLAAGPGTRMKSARQKVLLEANGLPLIEYVLRATAKLRPLTTTIVVGHGAEDVGRYLDAWPEVNVVLQDPARGPVHAISKTEALLWDAKGLVVVVPGTAAALSQVDLDAAISSHVAERRAVTLLVRSQKIAGGGGAAPTAAGGFDLFGQKTEIAGSGRDHVSEVPGVPDLSGVAIFDCGSIFGLSTEVCRTTRDAAEFEAIPVACSTLGKTIGYWMAPDPSTLLTPKTRHDLSLLGRLLQRRRCSDLMEVGVSVVDPETTYVGPDVEIGNDSVIHPNVIIEGRTSIGRGCVVHGGSRLVDATLADRVVVQNHTVILSSTLKTGAVVGPFVHIRPGSSVGENARVGNFVELKKTALGTGSKANHLSYLGDATIGERVNIGAGTITCNYDGVHKHQTVIEDDVFIGSDSQLIAPVTVEKGAYVAAGSSITERVPAGALGIARSRQENKPGWVARSQMNKSDGGHK